VVANSATSASAPVTQATGSRPLRSNSALSSALYQVLFRLTADGAARHTLRRRVTGWTGALLYCAERSHGDARRSSLKRGDTDGLGPCEDIRDVLAAVSRSYA